MPGARVASGDRVTLRTAEPEDAGFLQRAYANPELRLPLGWDVRSRADLATDLEDDDGDDLTLLVCLDGDGAGDEAPPDDTRPIGCVVAGTHERARSGVGVWIVLDQQGAGYGREAVALLVDHLFRTYPHPAVHATALPDNDASRGLLESLGFEQEGRARGQAFWDGSYRDTIQYSLLREDWESG